MSSLKRSFAFVSAVLFVLSCISVAMAQVVTPRPSQKASVMQTIGVTDVTITYSRPGVKAERSGVIQLQTRRRPRARPRSIIKMFVPKMP